ncbi:MAG TPA: VOC family protein [Burkholderiales bacterium]|nr:VOC family protein [Burkholderiales bacterium]
MTPSAFEKLAAAQAPKPGKLTLDHVAHFVPQMDTAAVALEKLGFTLTPFSAQSHRLEPGGPLLPAGTGNRCIMLKRGYIECLAPIDDTPVANQLRAAIERYVGVHSIIFGTGAADRDHARLAREGFSPLEAIALQRQLVAQDGEHTARFTVVRVPPGTMPEGRIQYCQHHTPQFVWQPQWVQHANRATALTAVILCMDDPAEAAARYGRFTGLKAIGEGDRWHIDTARGRLLFKSPAVIRRVFNVEPATLPWITGYALASNNMDVTRKLIAATDFAHGSLDSERFYVVPPAGVGGIIVFEPAKSAGLEFSAGNS